MDEVFDLTRGVYRRIYSGFISGHRICSVSIGAEAWFWRLMALADDYGNLDANERTLHVIAGGRRDVTRAQSEAWLKELAGANLVTAYEVRGGRYLSIVGFMDLQPANRQGRRIQRVPNAPLGSPGESRGVLGHPGAPIPIPIPIPRTIPIPSTPPALESVPHWTESKLTQAAEQIHAAYPRRVGRADSIRAAVKAMRLVSKRDHAGDDGKAFEWLLSRVRAYAASPYCQTSPKQFIPHPATWLNSGRYDDDDSTWAEWSSGDNGSAPKPMTIEEAREYVRRTHGED